MTTKPYPIVCPSCGGTGLLNTYFYQSTTVMQESCPVCNGSKVVIVTETTDDTKFGTFTNSE